MSVHVFVLETKSPYLDLEKLTSMPFKQIRKIPSYVAQLVEVLPLHIVANDFIKTNHLWKGLFKLKWVFWLALLMSVIISFEFIAVFYEWVRDIFLGQHHGSVLVTSSAMFSNLQFFGEELYIGGGVKYLIFIFAEVIIFHCTVNTLNILSGNNRKPSFKDFIDAEKRMIQVSLMAWFMEIIVSFIATTILSIFGLHFLKSIAKFIIQCYFIGHLFLDNYNEQYGLTVKESFKLVGQHAGASLGIGFIAYILFLIPLFGMIAAPVLGAVTAALYMYTHEVNRDRERLYELV